ncbi:MAG: hypothetical protein ACK4KW_03090 [Gemmobacter sp.]
MDTGGFGGSGGTGGSGGGNPGLQLARDACTRAVEARGQRNVTVTSISGTSTAATATLQSRRDPMTISGTNWRCTFSYETGRASVYRV